MTDIFTPEKRSWVMSRIKGKNTKIELKMKKMLA
ncbi:MAG: very short patch repair endonuclease, partial [Deltaproteobacteria bacterium]|nr:very short patch repair endonuclease [Deltaproteobacteria bacterium]